MRAFAQHDLAAAQATEYSDGKFNPATGGEGCGVSETARRDRERAKGKACPLALQQAYPELVEGRSTLPLG